MAQETLFIRLRGNGQVDWLQRGDVGPSATGQVNGLAALADPDAGLPRAVARIILIVPGCDVLLRAVELPVRSLAQARAALPWLLEDDMAAAPDSQHVALSSSDDAGQQLAVAAARDKMEAWTGALAAAGLTADRILPDFALLGATPENAVIAAADDMVLFAISDMAGGSCEPELAGRLLPVLLSEGVCRRVDLHGEDALPSVALPEGCESRRLPTLPADELLALMADNVARREDVRGERWPDLAQGPYAPRRERAFSRGRIKRLAVLAAALLVAHVAAVFFDMQHFADNTTATEQRIEAVFGQVAPEGSRIVNPRAQLANMKRRLGGQGGGFIDLSRMLYRAISAQPGVVLQALTYDARSQSLRVEARLRDFDDIEALKSHLREFGGVLEDSGARQSEGRILGEFTLKEASS